MPTCKRAIGLCGLPGPKSAAAPAQEFNVRLPADQRGRRSAGDYLSQVHTQLLTIANFTGHPSLTLSAGFVEVAEARSDWAPDPQKPLPRFSPPRRVPHGVTLIGKLFDEGILGTAGLVLERSLDVANQRPPGF